MTELKVLKNHCRVDRLNEYIIIDPYERTQAKVLTSYEGLNDLLSSCSFVGISPLEYMSYMNYAKISLGQLIPLPF